MIEVLEAKDGILVSELAAALGIKKITAHQVVSLAAKKNWVRIEREQVLGPRGKGRTTKYRLFFVPESQRGNLQTDKLWSRDRIESALKTMEGCTIKQLADSLDVLDATMGLAVKRGVKEGWLKAEKVTRPRFNGRQYRLSLVQNR